MYAIIATGGKQYKVAEGDVIRVEKLGAEAGSCLIHDISVVILYSQLFCHQFCDWSSKASELSRNCYNIFFILHPQRFLSLISFSFYSLSQFPTVFQLLI